MDAASLQKRWTDLLDNWEIARSTVEGLDRLPLETIQRIRKMRFFTSTEEDAIKSVTAAQANVEAFADVLQNYGHLFFPGRQPEDLFANWKYLSQRVKTALGNPPPPINPELPRNLEEVRKRNRIPDIYTAASCFGKAMIDLTHSLNFRAKHIGCEVAYLKAIGERLASRSLPDQQRPKFQRDHRLALAFLSGVCVDYSIFSEEATFGYSNEVSSVEIDLSLEGSISDIDPMQGCIFLDVEGSFFIENLGASPISVNNALLTTGEETELADGASVDIGSLSFQFFKNLPAIKRFMERMVKEIRYGKPNSAPQPGQLQTIGGVKEEDDDTESDGDTESSDNEEPEEQVNGDDSFGRLFADESMDED